MNRTELMQKLNKDIVRLKRRIQYKNFYNIRNYIVSICLKLGIYIDFCLPFVMSLIIACNTKLVNEKELITFSEKKLHQSIETIDTSDGSHIENVNSNAFDNNFIECSFVFKDNNIYKRTIITYEIDEEIKDISKLLSMDNAELVKFLDGLNIKKTSKVEKSEYVDDYIMIVNHKILDKKYKVINITKNNINNILRLNAIYLAVNWIYGLFQKKFLKEKIKELLEETSTYFMPITDEELNMMIELLNSKMRNMELLNDSEKNSSGPCLRRKI